ncbi:MAG: hypothetical protein KJO98_04410 [Rhodothermia bacterium]|nr:hypothetical protein [Rhodothermia bacterium]
MGKAALLAIAAFAAMSALYTGNTKRGLMKASERVANHQYETIARSAAVNGFNLAKQALAESFASRNFGGQFERANYDVTISVSGNRAIVTSIGDLPNASGDQSTYRLRGEFFRSTSAPSAASEVPEFMNYALLSEGDLRVSGNAGTASVYAGGDLNANFHTNGDLEVNGKGNKRIQGFGTYSGSASGTHRNTKFQPAHNPDGADHTSYAASVEIPEFDVSEYAAFATTTSESTILSGVLAGGTRDEPMVWLINGDLTVNDVVIDGYVAFLVTGDIDVNGNATVGSSGYSAGDESSIAFYGGGDVNITGGAQVWAQMYSEGDFELGGGADLYGSATSLSTAWLHGNPEIHYREASPALTTIWNGTPGGTQIRMTSFFEK